MAAKAPAPLIRGFWGVRYQVKDVQRSIDFYTKTLGFTLDMQHLPAFGQVSGRSTPTLSSTPRDVAPLSRPGWRLAALRRWRR